MSKAPDEFLRQKEKNSIFLYPTSEVEVFNILTSLKNKKSSGHHGISNVLLKEIGYCLLSQITDLINKSIELGQVPDVLKVAKVLPLYKSKESNKFTNYRPISLMNSLSIILERVVHFILYSFLQENNLLDKNQ